MAVPVIGASATAGNPVSRLSLIWLYCSKLIDAWPRAFFKSYTVLLPYFMVRQEGKCLIYGGRYWDRTSGPCRV